MNKRAVFSVFFRYVLLIIIGMNSLFLFYFIFTPFTVYGAFSVLHILYDASIVPGTVTPACEFFRTSQFNLFLSAVFPAVTSGLSNFACIDNVIFFKGLFASIIPACVAGAAYYLLLILNLTTPMPIKKRAASIAYLFLTFLFLNVLRIIAFAAILSKGYQYFDITHTATWYFGSTVLVVLIWFSHVLIFRIREIPVYSDIKQIFQDIKKPEQVSSRYEQI